MSTIIEQPIIAVADAGFAADAVVDPEARFSGSKEGRVIIRNLAFDLKESHLQKDFAKYGKIVELNLPIKNETNLNRGFAFIEFETKDIAKKVIDLLNEQKYKGRTVQLEFSVPKAKYESRVEKIMTHTKQTRADIVVPKSIKKPVPVVPEVPVPEVVEEVKKTKTQERKDKKAAKEAAKEAINNPKKEWVKRADGLVPMPMKSGEANKTLFVRNIGYDTTQEEFKEFMEKFGPVKYAVLVKNKELADPEATGADAEIKTHKGTGFVQFKALGVAEQVMGLSQQIECKLDDECRAQRLQQAKTKAKSTTDSKGVISVITAELELNGRRLVVMEAMGRGEQPNQLQDKKKLDKRNLASKREGLLTSETWIHQFPRPNEVGIKQRQRLMDEKDKALQKSTNLSVSKRRVALRNLPRKDFLEKELKELCLLVISDFHKTLPEAPALAKIKAKKMLTQVKVLRDEEKLDQATGEKAASGLGFAEFAEEDLANYAVRYLNNMELVQGKGIIADFALEDARVLHKREQRRERQVKLTEVRKRDQKYEAKNAGTYKPLPSVVDLSKKIVDPAVNLALTKYQLKRRQQKTGIDTISDVEALHRLFRDCNSRGKKQRIKKRIDFLEGKTPEVASPGELRPEVREEKREKFTAKEKVKTLLKKRDEKLKQKQEGSRGKTALAGLDKEDIAIMKKVKSKKADTKRKRARETDEFDDLLAKYKSKVLKSIDKVSKKKEKKGGHEFEEIEMSD